MLRLSDAVVALLSLDARQSQTADIYPKSQAQNLVQMQPLEIDMKRVANKNSKKSCGTFDIAFRVNRYERLTKSSVGLDPIYGEILISPAKCGLYGEE